MSILKKEKKPKVTEQSDSRQVKPTVPGSLPKQPGTPKQIAHCLASCEPIFKVLDHAMLSIHAGFWKLWEDMRRPTV